MLAYALRIRFWPMTWGGENMLAGVRPWTPGEVDGYQARALSSKRRRRCVCAWWEGSSQPGRSGQNLQLPQSTLWLLACCQEGA